MARIIEGPKEKTVRCDSCEALIGYLPEEVQYSDSDHYAATRYQRVKCPRTNCPGHGYIKRWSDMSSDY